MTESLNVTREDDRSADLLADWWRIELGDVEREERDLVVEVEMGGRLVEGGEMERRLLVTGKDTRDSGDDDRDWVLDDVGDAVEADDGCGRPVEFRNNTDDGDDEWEDATKVEEDVDFFLFPLGET